MGKVKNVKAYGISFYLIEDIKLVKASNDRDPRLSPRAVELPLAEFAFTAAVFDGRYVVVTINSPSIRRRM